MHQLEIKYFFPLTEQMDLDLDYKPCNEFEESKRELWLTQSVSGTYLISGGNGVTWATISNNIEPNFTIDIDQTPITIRSKEKPNLFRRYIYKILGMKWKAK
jgi:hypothetical protein